MPNSATIPTTGRTQATQTLYNNVVKDAIRMLAVAGATKTIATDEITVAPVNGEGFYRVDTEAAASFDFLVKINGGADGDIIGLVLYNASHTIELAPSSVVGGIDTNTPIMLSVDFVVFLRHNGSNWKPIHRFYNGSQVMTDNDGSMRGVGEVVVFDTSVDLGYKSTTTEKDLKVAGIVAAPDNSSIGGAVHTVDGRICSVICNTGAVAKGDYLITSTTAGQAKSNGATREAGVFGIALTAKSAGSAGPVTCMIEMVARKAV